ncbi:MAG: FtsX-like permease family protein [Deltaproteobacteria bacterium]|jgi:ABC-type lipoprotein release transport system permease subunit|nr:FtsX-like permease family protein [Deltaproteobacteria bacterium]
MIFIHFALRNIRAYAARSLVTILLLSLTTAMLVFATAFMDGSHDKMLSNAVEIYPGYIQITHRDFRDKPSLDNLIFDVEAVARAVDATPGIAAAAPRFETFVLFAADEKAVGGMLSGVDFTAERRLSRLASSRTAGLYPEDDAGNQLYLGYELARRLQVEVGEQLAFVGTGADYSFAADNLVVAGIFRTGLFDFDATAAFVGKDYFDRVMVAANYASHFIVLPEDPRAADQVAAALNDRLDPEYVAESWRTTMEGLVQAMLVDSIFGYLTLAVIFIVIFFVVLIYTWLTVFARMREIGVLRALGTRPGQILQMLLAESVLLALVSVVLGGLIGAGLAWYFHLHPITLAMSEEVFKQYGLAASSMPTTFAPLIILRDMAVMFVLAVLSTLYPIIKANRLRPMEAIHHV